MKLRFAHLYLHDRQQVRLFIDSRFGTMCDIIGIAGIAKNSNHSVGIHCSVVFANTVTIRVISIIQCIYLNR